MVAGATTFNASELPPELTPREAAEALGVHVDTVRKNMAEGSLVARNAAPAASRRPTWRIPLDAVLEFRGSYEKQGAVTVATISTARPRKFVDDVFGANQFA
jgi:excisionase family DNA binding protein